MGNGMIVVCENGLKDNLTPLQNTQQVQTLTSTRESPINFNGCSSFLERPMTPDVPQYVDASKYCYRRIQNVVVALPDIRSIENDVTQRNFLSKDDTKINCFYSSKCSVGIETTKPASRSKLPSELSNTLKYDTKLIEDKKPVITTVYCNALKED